MIMAAGVGSRLDPLTQEIPKPLVPVLNKPVMDILLQKLKEAGIEEVIANTHYLAEKIQKRYCENSPVEIKFDYIFEETLSGPAGGVKKCEFFFEDIDDFLVLSADGLHDADLSKIVKSHYDSGCIATMATIAIEKEEVSKYGVVVSSPKYTINEFQEKPPMEEAKSNFINTGIYVFNKRIFNFIPENTVYDFAKDVFPALLEAGEKINTYKIYSYWSDIGTIDQYIRSNKDALAKKVFVSDANIMRKFESVYTIGQNCVIDSSVKLVNNCVIGDNCKIGKNVVLDNAILWDNVTVEDNVEIKDSVIADRSTIKISLDNEIVGSSICKGIKK
jgi:mannose-1-phosphate guanylyltransferase/mannose-1-phosphate guanylyltransferase/phosphomannomutase